MRMRRHRALRYDAELLLSDKFTVERGRHRAARVEHDRFCDQCLNARRRRLSRSAFSATGKRQKSFHEPDGPPHHPAVGRPRGSPWCRSISTHGTNSDSNLWASPVTEVFDKLFTHLNRTRMNLRFAGAQSRCTDKARAKLEPLVRAFCVGERGKSFPLISPAYDDATGESRIRETWLAHFKALNEPSPG
jgi:hypothetical protein